MRHIEPKFPVPGDSSLGKAMKACTPGERAFVCALLETGGDNYTRAAQLAGYCAESDPEGSAMRVAGHRLAHSERVIKAIKEEAEKRLHTGALLGASVIIEIARDPTHKDRLKAAERLLNQSGLDIAKRFEVTDVTPTRTRREIEQLIRDRLSQLGPQGQAVIAAHAAEVVDAEFTEVDAAEEW